MLPRRFGRDAFDRITGFFRSFLWEIKGEKELHHEETKGHEGNILTTEAAEDTEITMEKYINSRLRGE